MHISSTRTSCAIDESSTVLRAIYINPFVNLFIVVVVLEVVHATHSSKCLPRFGSARLLASTFLTLLSGLTTMIGTGE